MHIFTDTSFQRLSDQLVVDIVENIPKNPLTPTIVVTPWYGIEYALSLRIAEHSGVCMNIDFFRPQSFIQYLLGLEDDKQSFPYSPAALTWQLFLIIQDLRKNQQKNTSHVWRNFYQFFAQDSSIRQIDEYQLAICIAKIIDRYSAFYPQNLQRWSEHKYISKSPNLNEEWIAELFRQACQKIPLLQWEKKFAITDKHIHHKSIFLFNVHWFHSMHWHFISQAHYRIPFRYYLISTPRTYLENLFPNDFITESEKLVRLSMQRLQTESKEIISQSNKQNTSAVKTHTKAINQSPSSKADSLLSINHSLIPKHITIRSAESLYMEVIALHQYIVYKLTQNPKLRLDDIVVYVADLMSATPYIETVFNGPNSPLKHIIIQETYNSEHASSIQEIWCFLTQIITLESIENLFKLPNISQYLENSQRLSDWKRCLLWLEQAGFRSGITGNYGLKKALQRLLLSVAVDFQTSPLPFDETAACSHIEDEEIYLLEQMVTYFEGIIHLHNQISSPKSLQEWSNTLQQILCFFLGNESLIDNSDSFPEVLYIQSLIETLQDHKIESGKIDHVTFFQIYTDSSTKQSSAHGIRIFTEGIIFLPMQTFHFIEKKVSCIIGFANDNFPRHDQGSDLDFVEISELESFVVRDQQLFLNILMNTQQALYLSYPITANSLQDRSSMIEASSLCRQLIEFIENQKKDGLFESVKIYFDHFAFPRFAKEYYYGDHLQIYNEQSYRIAKLLQKNQNNKKPAATHAFVGEDVFQIIKDQESKPLLRFNHVLQLLNYPQTYFLKHHYQIETPPKLEETFRDSQSAIQFPPTGYTESANVYKQIQSLLNNSKDVLPQLDFQEYVHLLQAKGLIAPESLGSFHFDDLQQTSPLLKALEKYKNLNTHSLTIQYEGKSAWVCDVLSYIGLDKNTMLFVFLSKKLNRKQYQRAWLEHLFIKIYQPHEDYLITYCAAIEKKIQLTSEFTVDIAKYFLTQCLESILSGLYEPLPFFPELSYDYSKHILKQWNKNNTKETVSNVNEFIKFMQQSDPDNAYLQNLANDWENPSSKIYKNIVCDEHVHLLWQNKNPFAMHYKSNTRTNSHREKFHRLSLCIYLPMLYILSKK